MPACAEGEFLGLEWSDLDFKRRSIHVQRSEWQGHVTVPRVGAVAGSR